MDDLPERVKDKRVKREKLAERALRDMSEYADTLRAHVVSAR